jgi:hypothetical protein
MMKVMGLSETRYWLHWLVTELLMVLPSILIISIGGKFLGLFTYSSMCSESIIGGNSVRVEEAIS